MSTTARRQSIPPMVHTKVDGLSYELYVFQDSGANATVAVDDDRLILDPLPYPTTGRWIVTPDGR